MDDYAVIVSGVQQMLAPYADRIQVVELVSLLPVESEIDVLLYDTYSQEQVEGQPEQVIAETEAKVVLYTWHLGKSVVSRALAAGAVACLSKSLSGDELVDALERVHRGDVVVSDDPGPDAPVTTRAWPGKEHGLSPRESEIIALIAQGLSNQEVARARLPQHQLGQDVHPVGVPQDRRAAADPGGAVGDRARVRPAPDAHHPRPGAPARPADLGRVSSADRSADWSGRRACTRTRTRATSASVIPARAAASMRSR